MRLTRIELFGFKSFADRTTLELPAGLTAIVGPNGCGKSNVMDAVKWVLGEQRPTHLRGDEMMDVVFKGNGARGARNFAEASLVFDNSDGSMSIDFTEVVLTRRLYRSGESEYLINRQAARLKDIRNLLMDTGLGTSAYSIMEQGRIDAILSANPAERRRIFEEAAGISRYRAQRREAELKLARTEQNLLRLGDIVEELEKRSRSLKNQAGRARSYVAARERVTKLKALFYSHRWSELGDQLDELSGAGGGLEESEAQARVQVNEARAALEAMQTDLDGARGKVDAAAEAFRQATGAAEALGQRKHALEERLAEFAERRAALSERIELLENGLTDRREEVAAIEARSEELTRESESCRAVLTEKQTAHTAAQRSLDEWLRADAVRRNEALERASELTETRNLLATTGSREAGLSASRDRISERCVALGAQLAEHQSIEGKLDLGTQDLDASLEAAQQDVEERRRRKDGLASEIEVLDSRQVTLREQLAANDSRRAAIEELIARREGVSHGARTLLESEMDGVESLVVDHVRAPTDLTEAVEAALGASAEAVIVSSRAHGLEALEVLREREAGRVMLLPRAGTRPHDGAASGERLIDRLTITGEREAVNTLLGHVRLVSSAEAFLDVTPDGVTAYVTPSGELMDERGVLRGGRSGREGGLVARQAEADELKRVVAGLRQELAAVTAERSQHLDMLVALEGDLDGANTRVRKFEAERERAREEQRQVVARREALRRDVASHEHDLEQLARELVDVVATQRHAKEREAELAAAVERDQAEEEARTAQRGSLDETVAKTQAAVGVAQSELSRREERREGLTTELRQAQRALTEREEDLRRTRAELDQLGDQETAQRVEADELVERTGEVESERERCAKELEQAKQVGAELHEKLVEHRAAIATAESALEAAADGLAKHRMREQEARIHRDTLRQKVIDELDVDLETDELAVEPLDSLPAASTADDDEESDESEGSDVVDEVQAETEPEAADEVATTEHVASEPVAELDWDAIEAEIEQLRQKMARMGNVNLGAIDELAEVDERLGEITGQRDDLDSAKGKLAETITRLNKESKERFIKTFEEVRDNFRTIFRKLFHGGKADITMKEGDDVLEAGVDIVAAPPGKDARSISLLSGGERTMTAVGLLFALFKTRPSPVCLLDEVDAALDETNIDRFCTVLEDFLGQSQFVVVTHARRTMSYADTIFGITMQEHGVSRALSLTMEQVEESQASGRSFDDIAGAEDDITVEASA